MASSLAVDRRVRLPLHEACEVGVAALRSADTRVEQCLLVAFDQRTARFWGRMLRD